MQDVKRKEDKKIQLEVQERVISLKYDKKHTVHSKEFKSRSGKQRALITSDKFFDTIDEDNSGFIRISELRSYNENKIELLDEIIREADKYMNRTLDKCELKELWHKIVLPKRRMSFFEINNKSNIGMVLKTKSYSYLLFRLYNKFVYHLINRLGLYSIEY